MRLPMRVIEFVPDENYGFAVSIDPDILRKVFVHQDCVVTFGKRLQIGSLIACDVIRPQGRQRHWRGENIEIVK